ncbi:MBOAT family O-acyltransferase [Vibrio rhizosphaerae]|uniref:MBOAT family O-acyltransferase n=1 Tax=Vibrio rhizosphaerae TaxID=398736 RepID=UPI00056E1515|nr:MBOAT family O-acyltransferase [Vibrio rhizosphaerae]
MVTVLIFIYFISAITNSKRVVIFSGVLISSLLYPLTFVFVLMLAFLITQYKHFLYNREVMLALVFLLFISLKNSFLPIDIRGDLLGLSFVLFQSCYYIKEEISLYTMVSRLSFFPQMYCGPVVKSSDFIRNKKMNIKSLALYHIIFSVGLFYKTYITHITHYVYANDDSLLNSIYWWAYMYSDFLSWSLMGIGIAGLSGFKMPISFKSPFFSKNISQFYRRWNITIYQWCIDFIKVKIYNKFWAYTNIGFATASLALWHGLGFNFILFGLFNFIYFFFQNKIKKKNKLLWGSQIIYYAFIGFLFNGFLPSNLIPIISNWSYFTLWFLCISIMLFFDYKSFSLVRKTINRHPYFVIMLCLSFVVFTLFFRKVDGQFYYAQF